MKSQGSQSQDVNQFINTQAIKPVDEPKSPIFNIQYQMVKNERIQKLKDILTKNCKIRSQEKQPIVYNKNQILLKRSKQFRQNRIIASNNSIVYKNLNNLSKKNDNNSLQEIFQSSRINITNDNNSIKNNTKVKLKDLFSNRIIDNAIKKQYQQQQQSSSLNIKQQISLELDKIQNPQKGSLNSDRHYLKMKLKILNFQSNELNKSITQKQNSNSGKLNKSILKLQSIRNLLSKKYDNYQQKQKKKQYRKKVRDLSMLNLTKIQHLPQIVFPKNKRCQKRKSKSSSQIDNILITNQILLLKKQQEILTKQRQVKEKLFKTRIKYNKPSFRHLEVAEQ